MKWVSSFCLLVVFGACKSPKYMPMDEGIIPAIHFGQGGGFAGSEEEWALLENGHVFQFHASTQQYVFHHKITSREKDQLFSILENIDFLALPEGSGGNRYRFVEWRRNGIVHRVSWDRDGQYPFAEMETLFFLLKKQTDDVK